MADLDAVELIGGGTRIPRVQALLSEVLGGRGLDRHLDSDEAVVMGAGLVRSRVASTFSQRPRSAFLIIPAQTCSLFPQRSALRSPILSCLLTTVALPPSLLQTAANLSTTFRLRKFGAADAVVYPINVESKMSTGAGVSKFAFARDLQTFCICIFRIVGARDAVL